MARAFGTALALIALHWPPSCSPAESAAPKWENADASANDKLKTLAQDALRHASVAFSHHHVVLEVLSAQTMKLDEAGATKYNVTYKASPTNCSTSTPFKEATCKVTAAKAEKQCSTTFLEMPAEEFYQIQGMMCFDIYYEQ